MDSSVTNFFTKNADQGYLDQYELDHGPRLDDLVRQFNLHNLKNQRILDVGGGLGFLGKRLDKSNKYVVIDGAEFPVEKRLCSGTWLVRDLDYEQFGNAWRNSTELNVYFENFEKAHVAFCLETLEHLTNPYNCLFAIKKIVETNGDIYISIPCENVWHNAIYPGLLWPKENFEQFLGQMALPIIEYYRWNQGWNTHTWKLRNAPWTEAKMLFPKNEPKFYGKTPVEYVNL